MSRKGVVYTISAILLLVAIASLFFSQSGRTGHDVHRAVSDRVLSVDKFIKNLEEDTKRAAYIAGFRSMIAMEQYVTSEGAYLSNPDAVFKEIFLTGNISTTSFTIMENSSFNAYILRIKDEAGEQGIVFDAAVRNLTLWQTEPWTVKINYTLDLNVTDSRGTASWEVTRVFVGTVPIIDLRDPLFSVKTLSRVQRVVKQTNVTEFVNDVGDANDTTGLMAHYNNSFYVSAGRGPSILMRFAGNFSDSPFGFESLVDKEEISAQGLTVNTTASIVDYKYFSGVTANVCNVQNLPNTMRFETSDLVLYEIEGNLTYVSC